MKNATLVISNPEGLEQDVWTENSNFSEEQWKSAIAYLVFEGQELYDRLSEETGGTSQVYALGDMLNLLRSIDIRVEK